MWECLDCAYQFEYPEIIGNTCNMLKSLSQIKNY